MLDNTLQTKTPWMLKLILDVSSYLSRRRTNPGVDLAMESGSVGLLASAWLAQCDIWSNRIRNLDPP